MSWDDYEALGAEVRGEYVDGELVVSPLPTRRHQDISLNLAILFRAVLAPPARVVESWGWKPGTDEFGPDVMIFDDNGEQARYTGTPHLVVEVLSSDPARDIVRKAAKYAASGLERYWIVDPDGPEIIVYKLIDGVLVEQGRHSPGTVVTLDVGPTEATLDPASLLD
jgi:Uma2 family endonuclease